MGCWLVRILGDIEIVLILVLLEDGLLDILS